MFLARESAGNVSPCGSAIIITFDAPGLSLVLIPEGNRGPAYRMGLLAATVLAMVMTSISCPASGSVLPEMQGPAAAGGQQSPVSWAGAEGIRRRQSGRRMRAVIGEHPLRLRGGAGGGRQRMIGGNRKGYMLGLKKTDGLELIREDPMNPPLPRDPDEVGRAHLLAIRGTMHARMRILFHAIFRLPAHLVHFVAARMQGAVHDLDPIL
jgi:hypothetical protein